MGAFKCGLQLNTRLKYTTNIKCSSIFGFLSVLLFDYN